MHIADVLKKPLLSEKNQSLNTQNTNVYVFEIDKRANKNLVKEAMNKLYKIKPIKVNITYKRGKNKRNRYGYSLTATRKKAYIYCNVKDKIDILTV